MYVACQGSNKIVKTTLDGKLLSAVGTKGSGHLQFHCPTGLCQDTASNVYVADSCNHRVQVLGPDFSYQTELESKDTVRGVAVDFQGNVHFATLSGVKIFETNFVYCDQAPQRKPALYTGPYNHPY